MTQGKRKKSVTIYLTDLQLEMIENEYFRQFEKYPLLSFQSFLRQSLYFGSYEDFEKVGRILEKRY